VWTYYTQGIIVVCRLLSILCSFPNQPKPSLGHEFENCNIMQARTPLSLEYTGARDLMGHPVIEDGLARVSAPRSARKRVRGMKQQRPLQAVLGVNDLSPHDNALHYSVTVNTDCGMYWASVWLTPALKDADLVRWLVEELASRLRSCCCSISCSVGHRCIMGSRCVFLSVVCSLVRRVVAVCVHTDVLKFSDLWEFASCHYKLLLHGPGAGGDFPGVAQRPMR